MGKGTKDSEVKKDLKDLKKAKKKAISKEKAAATESDGQGSRKKRTAAKIAQIRSEV